MSVIGLQFTGLPELKLSIDNHDMGDQYFNLVKSNYLNQKPIFRDRANYTIEYMHSLVEKAKESVGWDWQADKYSINNTTLFHKDLEELLGKVGFKSVPAEFDDLLHELHYCLHLLEFDIPKESIRNGWLQIEWYNNSGFSLDPNFKFKTKLNFGDVKLQNPFVGHGPMQIYYERDFSKISQTCKFHDFVKPGINLVTMDFDDFDDSTDIDALIEEFKRHDPTFVDQHGIEKIIRYIGHPVVGQLLNKDDLHIVLQAPTLEFESLSFYE
jgi:hypothetical protein